MFNIIDSSRGVKADLVPITMEPRYQQAFHNRIRRRVNWLGIESFEIWCARPEDIIVGKLMAWTDGQSRKHETDIYEMVAANRWQVNQRQAILFDLTYIDQQAAFIGEPAFALWNAINSAVDREFE